MTPDTSSDTDVTTQPMDTFFTLTHVNMKIEKKGKAIRDCTVEGDHVDGHKSAADMHLSLSLSLSFSHYLSVCMYLHLLLILNSTYIKCKGHA